MLKKIPLLVWAMLATAIIIGSVKLLAGGGSSVPVVGAGALAALRPTDAPPGYRFVFDVAETESLEASAQRIEEAIGRWPNVIVIGLDAAELGDDAAQDRALQTLARLAKQAENALAVPVVVGFVAPEGASAHTRAAVERLAPRWREQVCGRPGVHVCLETPPVMSSPAAFRKAVTGAVADAGWQRMRRDASDPTTLPARP